MKPLENQVAIVTGSTSGIGLALAESLAGAGAKLVLNGLGDPAQIEAVAPAVSRQDVVARTACNGPPRLG